MSKAFVVLIAVIALLIPEAIIQQEQTIETLDTEQLTKSTDENNLNAEMRLHSQGGMYNDEEKLIWSPNNNSLNNIIQVSIMIDELILETSINEVNTSGYWIYQNSSYLQFTEIAPSFTLQQINDSTLIVFDLTYPATVFGGNYTLSVNISFQDQDSYEISHYDLFFLTYDYQVSVNDKNEDLLMCVCSTKVVEILVNNTGEIGTVIEIEISIESSTYRSFQLAWVEDTEEGLFDSGEGISRNLSIDYMDSDVPKNRLMTIPISIEVSYLDEEDESIYLFQDLYFIEVTVLPKEANPEVELSLPAFNQSYYSQGQSLLKITNNGGDGDLFSLNTSEVQFNLVIENLGFLTQVVSIESNQEIYDFTVIYDDNSYTIQNFKNLSLPISRMDNVSLSIIVQNISELNQGLMELNIKFNNLFSTLIRLKLATAPVVSSDVISLQYNSLASISSSVEENITVDLDFSDFENFLLFENRWQLYCSVASNNASLTEIIETDCIDEDTIFQPEIDNIYSYSLDYALSSGPVVVQDNFTLYFILKHFPSIGNSSIDYLVSLDYIVNSTAPNNNSNNSDGNSGNDNNNANNSDNNSGDSDSNNSSGNNNTTGSPVDDCADIQCDACPPGMVNDPEGGCCACMEAPETNVDTGDQNDEQSEQQNDDSTKTATEESNMPTYLIIGLVIAALVAAVVIIRARKSSQTQQIVSDKTITQLPMPALPLPGLPIPSAPVVLQEWTDDNGYSWRHMSDRTIMWWNGSDWIPYGKN